MPVTLASLRLSWSNLQSVSAPSASANPVLRLKFNDNSVYWLKVAAGGQRIAFAETVMNRVGFNTVGSELLVPSEIDGLARFGVPLLYQPILKKMREELAKGKDLIFSRHVGGDGTYESKVYQGAADIAEPTAQEFKQAGSRHVQIMQGDRAQSDLARMIAVDLLLGNYDRAAISKKLDSGTRNDHFHLGNFIYDAASQGFLPIDNDTVAPSLKHMKNVVEKDSTGKKTSRKPTKEDLYRTAILGGALLCEEDVFAKPDQADLGAVLGIEAEQTIYQIMASNWGFKKTFDQQEELDLKAAARNMVPKVRAEMRNLIHELKAPGPNGQLGLFKTLKAYENVEGMDYTTFKVKSRFAELMSAANQPPSVDSGVKYAVSYGLYRDWKEEFLRVVNHPVPTYAVPFVRVAKLTSEDKAKRSFNTAATSLGILSGDKSETKAKELAGKIKKNVRAEKSSYNDLKTLYETRLKNTTDSDNRIVKAKLLMIGVLVKAELHNLLTMLTELTVPQPNQKLVARFYAKAFAKHSIKLAAVVDAYEVVVANLKRQVNSPEQKMLKSADFTIIGVGPSEKTLEKLCNDCRIQLGVLKALGA